MSDVSKTSELVEETRSRHKGAGMSDRFKFCLHCEDEWPCDASRLADALEAVTRVPVRGEPNDEPCLGCGSAAEDGHDDCTIKVRTIRATVPDAATEGRMSLAELEDIAETHAFCADRLFIETELVDEIRAERDAATAAVEQIREAVSGHPECDRYSEDDVISCGWKSAYASVVAALDGAPEPEWEYGYELIEPDDRNVFEREGDFISAAFAYRAAKKRIHEERHPDVPSLQYSIMHRRKAGPWLPVEGEKP